MKNFKIMYCKDADEQQSCILHPIISKNNTNTHTLLVSYLRFFREKIQDATLRTYVRISTYNKLIKNYEDNDNQDFDSDLLSDADSVVNEELIYGYKVLYQHRKKRVMQKSKDGGNHEKILNEIRIISIVEPLTNNIVNNYEIKNTIIEKISQR